MISASGMKCIHLTREMPGSLSAPYPVLRVKVRAAQTCSIPTLCVNHSRLRKIKSSFRLKLELSVQNSQGNFWEETLSFSFFSLKVTMWHLSCCVCWCKVSLGNLTVALCDIFKEVFAAFAAALCVPSCTMLLLLQLEFIVTNASLCYILFAS